MAVVRLRAVGMVAGERLHIVRDIAVGDPVLVMPDAYGAATGRDHHDPTALALFTAPATVLASPAAPTPSDRRLLMDRHAGYVGAQVAARWALPDRGVMGTVAEVRHPPEWEPGADTPVGFDVTVKLPTDWIRR